ncbi:hypothetical protein J7643_03315 [bacterium]|nr:hypothetical protein [bacterium]
MSKSKLIAPLALATMLSGCASIMSGGQPMLNVEVDGPSGDDIQVTIIGLNNGERIVRSGSNFTVPLSRNSDYKVTVKAANYSTEETIIRRNIRPIFWANFCCAPGYGVGLFGFAMDYLTHNMWEPDHAQVAFSLARLKKDKSSYVLPIELSNASGERFTIEAPVLMSSAAE